MASKIIWRYRRKRHSPSAAASRRQERGFGSTDSQASGNRQMNLPEHDHGPFHGGQQAAVQFQQEEETQSKVQFQEEEEAQGKVQFQEEEEAQTKPETVQKRSGRLIRAVAGSGFRGHSGSYPFRHRIQTAFGKHNISNVRAFNDAGANRANRRLGTLAYASRERVAFRGYPDLHTAAHEAAHIIQQRKGVNLKDGTGQKGDAYEHHADAVADRVVRGKKVESLLNRRPVSDGG